MSDDAIRDPDRLAALRRYKLLDTPPEDAFDQLTRVAAQLLDAPAALVSLIDSDRQFFKSCFSRSEDASVSERERPLSHSFCKHIVESREALLIDDAREHPLVKDSPAIRDFGVIAYAGVPLVDQDGHILGTLCVFDTKPRRWGEEHVRILQSLASAAMSAIVFRAAHHANQAQLDGTATTPKSTQAAEQVTRKLSAHLKALDAYQICINLADSSGAGLQREAECQRAVEESHQELERSLADLGAMWPETQSHASDTNLQPELYVAIRAYLDAKRRRADVLIKFQELRAALGEVERAAMDTFAAEHTLRTLAIAHLTKNE